MERKKANYAIKKEARRLYEVEGLSFPKIGKALGFHENTISGWRKAEGWAPKGSLSAGGPSVTSEIETTSSRPVNEDGDLVAAAGNSGQIHEASVHVESSDKELRDRIRQLEAENAELEKQVEDYRPDVDITMMQFQNEEDLAVIFDEQHWKDMAQRQFSRINQKRRIDGLEPLRFEGEELEDEIRRLKQEEIASRNKEATGPPDKRIKMVKPNKDGSYFPPLVVQLPYEAQVNNVAGSLADGVVIYTRKGFKMTSPFLCPRRNCFKPAAVQQTTREWAHDGYCSIEHFTEVEKPQNRGAQAHVTTKDLVGGYAR